MNILLLEDDLLLAAELKKYLVNHGYYCRNCFDGEHFLREINSENFDIYLLDINVPKVDGFEVLKKIRENNTQIPIIMLSAYGDITDKKQAYENFADDYLVKPFSFEELLMKINSLLRRKFQEEELESSKKIIISDLIIDLEEKKVIRENKNIDLTLREFKLLVFLAEAQGRTVSKQQITETVWDLHFSTNTNTVEVYINFLRKKIDKDFPTKLIHTRPGFGYFLKDLE